VYGERSNRLRKHSQVGRLFLSEAKGRHVILDLKNVTLANQDPINSLGRCETVGIRNCPAYIREWIMSQKSTLAKPVRVRRNNSNRPKA
jgi:hypothetical protein